MCERAVHHSWGPSDAHPNFDFSLQLMAPIHDTFESNQQLKREILVSWAGNPWKSDPQYLIRIPNSGTNPLFWKWNSNKLYYVVGRIAVQ